jgi:serine protease Do
MRIGFALVSAVALLTALHAAELDKRVRDLESQRIAAIDKVRPSVVAVFGPGGSGGGSGVLISKDGYALTNFHVVQGAGPIMQCGLADGVLYDAVLVGLDKVGDVALIKLLPKKEGIDFPFAPMGDSDKVKAGDWSLAMGNPFLLATDFTPTVTFGLVSGIHRYQYPAGTLLEYTDCIQIDTSINPGNSGGPLFNLDGEVIGINGRGSFEKRGRVNSGVGYAISINQIKNFMGHMRVGLDSDHATLGAMVGTSETEDEIGSRMQVRSILENSDAHRRGLDVGDELVMFAGRQMSSVNQFKNVLGLFPKGWRVPLVFRRNNERQEVLVRLMGVQQRLDGMEGKPRLPRPKPGENPIPVPKPPTKPSPASKLYEVKAGFANFYFNKLERDRLWNAFKKHGDFSSSTATWTITGELEHRGKRGDFTLSIGEERGGDDKQSKTFARLVLGEGSYQVEPLQPGQKTEALMQPVGSGGLLLALYHYRRLLTAADKGFEGGFSHGGQEPFYPMPADGAKPKSYRDIRIDTEVLQTEHAAIPAKWYFSLTDQHLLGGEITIARDQDPCELYFFDYKPVDGRSLPHKIEVRHGSERWGVLTVKKYQLSN